MIGYWKKGDSRQYRYNTTTQRIKNGVPGQLAFSNSMLTIEVIDETDTSYTYHWTYDQLNTGISNPKVDTLMNEVIRDLSIQLDYKTAETGMNPQWLSPEQDPVRDEILIFHRLHGYEFDLGRGISNPMTIPSPLDGSPLPAMTTTELVSIDTTDQQAVIRMTVSIDPAALKRMNENVFGVHSLPEITSNTQLTYTIDIRTGWPEKIEYTREISGSDTKKVETYLLTPVE